MVSKDSIKGNKHKKSILFPGNSWEGEGIPVPGENLLLTEAALGDQKTLFDTWQSCTVSHKTKAIFGLSRSLFSSSPQ
jgi:hypothetical protein